MSAEDTTSGTTPSMDTDSNDGVSNNKTTVSDTNPRALTEPSGGNSKTEPEDQPPVKTDVRYKLELAALWGSPAAKVFESDKSFDIQLVERGSRSSQKDVVFDVVTYVIATTSRWNVPETGPNSQFGRPGGLPPMPPMHSQPNQEALKKANSIEDVHIHMKGDTRVVIYSELLMILLRRVASYYPGQNLSGTVVTFVEPYPWFMHHLDVMNDLLVDGSFAEEELPSEAELALQGTSAVDEARRQLKLLLDFLQPYVEEKLVPMRKLLARPEPLVTFNMLWYLLRPGNMVYICDYAERPYAAIVIRTKNKPPDPDRKIWRCRARARALACDGEDLVRTPDWCEIDEFKGQKDITSLDVFPVEYWDRKDGGERRNKFINRGKRLYRAIHEGSKELGYDGDCYFDPNDGPNQFDDLFSQRSMKPPDPKILKGNNFKKRKYRGRIIVDVTSSRARGTSLSTAGFAAVGPDVGDKAFYRTAEDATATNPRLFPFSEYEGIDVKEHSTLSDDHFVLMLPYVPCFALREKTWMLFEAESIHDLQPSGDNLSNLIIDPDDLLIIKTLAHRQQHSSNWDADFIRGKGSGQILLLHGPPGVGKTYTVECIAAAFQRPLLALTVADIGVDERLIERELTNWFGLATAWDAVVLIDEADVFLEQRQTRDLSRNSLVSVFLRTIEYFQGLLFLTTNRTGQIDDAFQSRLHGILNTRTAFFEKLRKDKGGKVIVGPQAKKFVRESDKVKELEWNGREIRNAFQTAVSLAEFEASEDPNFDPEGPVVVESGHFEKVCKMSKSFKDYMFKLKRADEPKRAKGRKDRHDYRDQETA